MDFDDSEYRRRLFETGNRDFTIDAIVASIVAVVLLCAVLLCSFYTFTYKATMIQPEIKVRDAYIQATIIFARLFQRPPKKTSFDVFSRSLMITNSPAASFRPHRPLAAERMRSSRNIGDSSFAFDLTNETSIFYSGTLFKSSNNIVARQSHLEYCFDWDSTAILPPTPGDSPRVTLNLQLAYLPTIKESKSMESLSTKSNFGSANHTPRDSGSAHGGSSHHHHHHSMRPRMKREILLFTGPEHRREWLSEDESADESDGERFRQLLPNISEEDSDDGFQWAFEDISSLEDDLLPPVPSMNRFGRK
jgi:hypothetical protein